MKPFYVTTPIYYVNDKPHIGHAYSTIAADVLARYQRLRGRPVRFLTGLDEHGLKLERRARQEQLAPKEFVDRMVPAFRRAWEAIDCPYDDFIRTTEPRHKARVQVLWDRLVAAGDVYLGEYEDWYCVGCEAFYTERDLAQGNRCPIHRSEIERVKERSYFFRLSRYTERLLEFYESNPGFVRPEGRFNEVKSFVREGLRDLSISRTSFRWGIPVPNDPEHVVYVWLDALTNYMSSLGGPSEPGASPLFDRFWTPSADVIHIVGKDILRFHAVFWPAFLMSAGIAPPTQVWAHGWLTVNGEKMSKSLGNFLPPEPIAEAVGADTLRFYLMREVGFGHDGDFSHRNLLSRYHGDLGNGLGNLLQRVVGLAQKHLDGRVAMQSRGDAPTEDRELIATAQRAAQEVASRLDEVAPHKALEAAWELVSAANRYVDRSAPWALAKEGQKDRLADVTGVVCEALRWLSLMLWPVMPGKCDQIRSQLGLAPVMPTEGLDRWPSAWGGLSPTTRVRSGAALFPRFDEAQELAILERLGASLDVTSAPTRTVPRLGKAAPPPQRADGPASVAPSAGPQAETESFIAIDDVAKVDLRVGMVRAAERVPKSDKLLCLQVDLGEDKPRQILAGIGKTYEPERLVGRQLIVVANLKPRKMLGLESQGMVLAASDSEALSVLQVDKPIAPGSRAK